MRHHTQLEPIANDIWVRALKALKWDHTRQSLQSKLLEIAADYPRDERLWIASRALAWSGYGGGVG